jgi:hypothetical protein
MKALFNNLKVGIEDEKIKFEGDCDLDLKEAYKMIRFLSDQIQELEDIQRKKLPWTKRLFK